MGLSIDVDDGDVEIRWALATGRGLTVGHDGYGLRARVHSWVRILTVDVEPSGVMRWYASAVGVKTDIDPNAEGIAPAGDSLAFLRPWLDGGRLPPEVVER